MKNLKIYLMGILLCFASACNFLDTEPKDRVFDGSVFLSDDGIKAYRAALYAQLPMEDYRYAFNQGYNVVRPNNPIGGSNLTLAMDAINTCSAMSLADAGIFNTWGSIYGSIRRFCSIPEDMKKMVNASDALLKQVEGEYHFFMAYSYFALARRYGGVPIVEKAYDLSDAFNGNVEPYYIARETEENTWRFILKEFDLAAKLLPKTTSQELITKWTALAVKSRAALFAASELKYFGRENSAPDPASEAVLSRLVFTEADSKNMELLNFFYDECAKAAAEVINSGQFALYGMTPSSTFEATSNYHKVSVDPGGAGRRECMFIRRYSTYGYSHNFGKNFEPFQIASEYSARCCPTLDLVESYQTIDENRVGGEYNKPLDNGLFESIPDVNALKRVNRNDLKRYDNIQDIYLGRDPRLYASVILPGEAWGTENEIRIQAGIIDANGNVYDFRGDKNKAAYEFDGQKYQVYGSKTAGDIKSCSGFIADNNHTYSGFLLKKGLLGDGKDQIYDQCVLPFTDIRYAEVLLNYAEAVAHGSAEVEGLSAKNCLNDIRKRAGFLDAKSLDIATVRAERRSELALEFYASAWDAIRLREAHLFFNNNRQRMGLAPLLDFSTGAPKWVFVRTPAEANINTKCNFLTRVYYRNIPGIESNPLLVKNPGY